MLVAIMFGVQQDAFKTTNNAKAELEVVIEMLSDKL